MRQINLLSYRNNIHDAVEDECWNCAKLPKFFLSQIYIKSIILACPHMNVSHTVVQKDCVNNSRRARSVQYLHKICKLCSFNMFSPQGELLTQVTVLSTKYYNPWRKSVRTVTSDDKQIELGLLVRNMFRIVEMMWLWPFPFSHIDINPFFTNDIDKNTDI